MPETVDLSLPDEGLPEDPLVLFERWWSAALERPVPEPTACALATVGPDGAPSVRVVLVKEVGPAGFTFFTNYESRKARELERDPRAALCFHWQALRRQVRVEGRCERLKEEENDAYFRTRPRGSQIGAWASRQSAEAASRAEVDRAFEETERRFSGREVPRPPFWGGYRLAPEAFEFWAHRADRLHDRMLYRREGGRWRRVRLWP